MCILVCLPLKYAYMNACAVTYMHVCLCAFMLNTSTLMCTTPAGGGRGHTTRLDPQGGGRKELLMKKLQVNITSESSFNPNLPGARSKQTSFVLKLYYVKIIKYINFHKNYVFLEYHLRIFLYFKKFLIKCCLATVLF